MYLIKDKNNCKNVEVLGIYNELQEKINSYGDYYFNFYRDHKEVYFIEIVNKLNKNVNLIKVDYSKNRSFSLYNGIKTRSFNYSSSLVLKILVNHARSCI